MARSLFSSCRRQLVTPHQQVAFTYYIRLYSLHTAYCIPSPSTSRSPLHTTYASTYCILHTAYPLLLHPYTPSVSVAELLRAPPHLAECVSLQECVLESACLLQERKRVSLQERNAAGSFALLKRHALIFKSACLFKSVCSHMS